MYVHVVKRGENLHGIARSVGVDADRVAELNGLVRDQPLPGSSLLVPTGVSTTLLPYEVREGDTLRKIAGRFRIPESLAAAANPPLGRELLTAGRWLTLPVPLRRKRRIEVNVRLDVQGEPEELLTLDEAEGCVSSLSIVDALIEADGTLGGHSIAADLLLESARGRGFPLLLTLAPGHPHAVEGLLTRPSCRRALFRELRPLIARDEFAGVHVEFGKVAPQHRPALNSFVRELAVRVHHQQGTLCIAVPAHEREDPDHPLHGAYDLPWLARYADRIMWNTGDAYGTAEGPPMAIAPLNAVRRSLDHALAGVPKGKLLLGLPFYGYDWATPYDPERGAALIVQGPNSWESEEMELPSQVHWDERAMAPMVTYRDEAGEMREVWYEDARSIAVKLHLVHELGLAGISCLVPGHAMSTLWNLLQDTFHSKK